MSHYVSFKKIEQAVIKAISEISFDQDISYEIIPAVEEFTDIKLSEEAMRKLDQKEARIKEAYINGIDSLEEYKENKLKIETERNRLSERIISIKRNSDSEHIKIDMISRVKNVLSIITSGSDIATKNTAIKSIVKKIVYTKSTENIDITLFYS